MSAFVCDPATFRALVGAACYPAQEPMRYGYGDRIIVCDATAKKDGERHRTPDSLVRMLASENIRSVAHRYDEPETSRELPGPIPTPNPRRLKMGKRIKEYSPQRLLGALHCYEYQSCEHPDWEASEAYAFCRALEHRLVHIVSEGWEITEP